MNLLLTLGFLMVTTSPMRFTATADSLHGLTAKGTVPRLGIVAADPAVLPLGSVIRVSEAGAYSGTYVVADTGPGIVGHHIDIYMPSRHEATQFGRKQILVRMVSKGDNRRNGREITSGRRPCVQTTHRQRLCKKH